MLLYLPHILYAERVGWLGPYTWFNPPKPRMQSMTPCGTVCALSIANSILLNWPIARLLILFHLSLYYLVSNIF